jgi:hypothetical protein
VRFLKKDMMHERENDVGEKFIPTQIFNNNHPMLAGWLLKTTKKTVS